MRTHSAFQTTLNSCIVSYCNWFLNTTVRLWRTQYTLMILNW